MRWPLDGVRLDHRRSPGGQRARLVDDLLGDLDLADVVQERGQLGLAAVVVGEAEAVGDAPARARRRRGCAGRCTSRPPRPCRRGAAPFPIRLRELERVVDALAALGGRTRPAARRAAGRARPRAAAARRRPARARPSGVSTRSTSQAGPQRPGERPPRVAERGRPGEVEGELSRERRGEHERAPARRGSATTGRRARGRAPGRSRIRRSRRAGRAGRDAGRHAGAPAACSGRTRGRRAAGRPPARRTNSIGTKIELRRHGGGRSRPRTGPGPRARSRRRAARRGSSCDRPGPAPTAIAADGDARTPPPPRRGPRLAAIRRKPHAASATPQPGRRP